MIEKVNIVAAASVTWVDGAAVAAVLMAVVIGYRFGGFHVLAKVFGYLVSIIAAGFLAGPVVNWLDAQTQIAARLGGTMKSYLDLPPEVHAISVADLPPELLAGVTDQMALPAPVVEQLSRQMASFAAAGADRSIGDMLGDLAARGLLQAVAFVVIAVAIASVVGRLAVLLTRQLERVPFAAKTNRLAGAGLSLVATVAGIALFFGLISPLLTIAPTGGVTQAILNSRVGSWLEPVHRRALAVVLYGAGPATPDDIAREPKPPADLVEIGFRVGVAPDPDSDVLMVAGGPGPGGMILVREPGSVQPAPAAAILDVPDAPPALFHFGDGGHVTRLEWAGWTLEFANHTESSVDMILEHPDGTRESYPDMPYEPPVDPLGPTSRLPSLGPSVAHAGSLAEMDSEEIRRLLRTTATAVGGVACTVGLISAAGTGGTLTPLVIYGCGSHFINVVSTLTGQSDLEEVTVAIDATTCGYGDIPACVALAFDRLAAMYPERRAVYANLTVSGLVVDRETQEPLDSTIVRVQTTAGRPVGSGYPEYQAYRGARYVGGQAGTAATNRWGTFEIRDIEDGAYTVEIERRGYVSQHYRMAVLPDRVRIVDAASGRQILDQDWRDIGLVRLLPAMEKIDQTFDGTWYALSAATSAVCGPRLFWLEVSDSEVGGQALIGQPPAGNWRAHDGPTHSMRGSVDAAGHLTARFLDEDEDIGTFSVQIHLVGAPDQDAPLVFATGGTWQTADGCSGSFTLMQWRPEGPFDGDWFGRAEDTTGDPDCGGGTMSLRITGSQVKGGAMADMGYGLDITATVQTDGRLVGGFADGSYDTATFSGQLQATEGTGSGTWQSEEGCGGTFTLSQHFPPFPPQSP